MNFRLPALFSIILLAVGCVGPVKVADRYCENSRVIIDARMEAGNLGECSFERGGLVSLIIHPENAPPINPSPWYAFRVQPKRGGKLTLVLDFPDGYARYWPKISLDGQHWEPLAQELVKVSDDGKRFTVSLNPASQPLYVAAQELLTTGYYEEWVESLAARDDIEARVIGNSVQGRPIHALNSPARKEMVLLLGRQHPPEITGAVAMRAFVATVLGDTPLARRFRDRYSVVMVPLINPDGVALGHWRHNVNGVDLNRDWGPFTQPETRSVAGMLSELEAAGSELRLMLDFHSTKSSLFYTQLPEEGGQPTMFATRWLEKSRQRLPGFEFMHAAGKTSDQPNAKNYFFLNYGIASITYELGDETPRDGIASSAVVFAEEMMQLMLDFEPGTLEAAEQETPSGLSEDILQSEGTR